MRRELRYRCTAILTRTMIESSDQAPIAIEGRYCNGIAQRFASQYLIPAWLGRAVCDLQPPKYRKFQKLSYSHHRGSRSNIFR